MKRVLLGAAGVLVLQAVLITGYLALSEQDPIVLNPERRLDRAGVTMAIFCGYSRPTEVLDGVPPDGDSGPWTRGGRYGAIASPSTTTAPGTAQAETRRSWEGAATGGAGCSVAELG